MVGEPEHNQPPVEIPGGPMRRSVRVPSERFPAVGARERVETALRTHDFDESASAIATLSPADLPIVRLIAQEGVASGVEPQIRYAAINVLAVHCTVENLNILADLAQFGEDYYVRGHALLALGQVGVIANLPIFAAHLESPEAFERAAAERALEALAVVVSTEAVLAHAAALRDANDRLAIEHAVARFAGREGEGRRGPAVTGKVGESEDRTRPSTADDG